MKTQIYKKLLLQYNFCWKNDPVRKQNRPSKLKRSNKSRRRKEPAVLPGTELNQKNHLLKDEINLVKILKNSLEKNLKKHLIFMIVYANIIKLFERTVCALSSAG